MLPDGTKHPVMAGIGEQLLDVIEANGVDIDGFGACEGTLACSTCHLIFKPEQFRKIHNHVTHEEMDMLDLAHRLCDTSRLACQVYVTEEMEGWDITVPIGMADARN